MSCKNCWDVAEELYNLNADISLIYIAMKKTPTQNSIKMINEKIGAAIKKLRGDDVR